MDRHERNFWGKVRRGLCNKTFVRRIENAVGAGDPDVHLMKRGKTRWLELKWATMPVRRTSKLLGKDKMRLDQINWHLEYHSKGGTSYVLVGTECANYLLSGHLADLLNDMTVEEIEANCVFMSESVNEIIDKALFK